jgi:hypothetical protein
LILRGLSQGERPSVHLAARAFAYFHGLIKSGPIYWVIV